MDVVNVVMLYLIIICNATNEFLLVNNKDLLNCIELNFNYGGRLAKRRR